MKSRVTPLIPKTVLAYALPADTESALRNYLAGEKILLRIIAPSDLSQTIGHLAGYPGFPELPSSSVEAEPCEGLICFSGLASKELDRIMNGLHRNNIVVPIKSVVTPFNQQWTFSDFIRELLKERRAFEQAGKQKN